MSTVRLCETFPNVELGKVKYPLMYDKSNLEIFRRWNRLVTLREKLHSSVKSNGSVCLGQILTELGIPQSHLERLGTGRRALVVGVPREQLAVKIINLSQVTDQVPLWVLHDSVLRDPDRIVRANLLLTWTELTLGHYTNFFLFARVCPHFNLLYRAFFCCGTNSKLALLLMELGDGTADELFASSASSASVSDDVMVSLVVQVLIALLCLKISDGVLHRDMTLTNVLYNKVDSDTIYQYRLFGKEYRLKLSGYLFKVIDPYEGATSTSILPTRQISQRGIAMGVTNLSDFEDFIGSLRLASGGDKQTSNAVQTYLSLLSDRLQEISSVQTKHTRARPIQATNVYKHALVEFVQYALSKHTFRSAGFVTTPVDFPSFSEHNATFIVDQNSITTAFQQAATIEPLLDPFLYGSRIQA